MASFGVVMLLAVSGCSKSAPASQQGGGGGQSEATATVRLPGLVYWNDRNPAGPWSVHIVKMDRNQNDLTLRSTLARNTVLGLDTLTAQLRTIPASFGKPVAAINGDFYVVDDNPYRGDPRGIQILEGELLSSPGDQVAFWMDPDSKPHTGLVESKMKVTLPDGTALRFRINEERGQKEVVLYTPRLGTSTRTAGGKEFVLAREGSSPWLPLSPGANYSVKITEIRTEGDTSLKGDRMVLSAGPKVTATSPLAVGDILKINTTVEPDMTGVRTAIGGGNVMVHEGKVADIQIPSSGAYKYRSVVERHPRSAIGFNKTHLFLVQVDGRQPALSVGMTLKELGKYMHGLGCEEAINFDGGGSATIYVNGDVVNSPCYGSERDIGNALVIVRRATSGATK